MVRGNLLEEPVEAIARAGRLPFKGVIHAVGPLDIYARAYVRAARASPLGKVRLCLRDQPVIDAVLEELKR